MSADPTPQQIAELVHGALKDTSDLVNSAIATQAKAYCDILGCLPDAERAQVVRDYFQMLSQQNSAAVEVAKVFIEKAEAFGTRALDLEHARIEHRHESSPHEMRESEAALVRANAEMRHAEADLVRAQNQAKDDTFLRQVRELNNLVEKRDEKISELMRKIGESKRA
jgi:hypothetical protein